MKTKKNSPNNNMPEEALQRELVAIKKLLVLILLKLGAKQDAIAVALQLDQSTISKWFKCIEIKKIEIIK